MQCHTIKITKKLSIYNRFKNNEGDLRETMYLFQRVCLAFQRYNSVAFKGTFLVPTELD